MVKKLIVVLGPTAVGKTDLSIALAEYYNTEIISSDSRQFYRDLSIGVARPDQSQLDRVPHHFIGFLPISEEFSAGKFADSALQKLNELFSTHEYVVCCGGSMLYIDALLYGLDELPSDPDIRKKIMGYYQTHGLNFLQQQIEELDPVYSKTVDLNNPHRLMRALEVCIVSGERYSDLRKAEKQERDFQIIKIGLNTSRDVLYERINRRVDMMMENGLENEARALLPYRSHNSLNTVGYKELFSFFDGETTLAQAVDLIKQHSRNYAKRQLTWWKRDDEINWFDVSESENLSGRVIQLLSEKSNTI